MTDLRASFTPDIHRMLPQAPDAEMGVLSSLILAPTEVFQLCEENGLNEATFHITAHQRVYSCIREIIESADSRLDFIRLTQLLRDKQQLESVGGASFITSLWTYLPTASNADYYIRTVCDKAKLRDVIQTGTEYAARAYEETEPEALIAGLESRVLLMTERATKSKDEKSAKELVNESMKRIQTLHQNRGRITGIETGYRELDVITNGLHADEFSVIAATSGTGKTAYLHGMIENISLNQGIPCALFSLEMSDQQNMDRFLLSVAKVNLHRIRDGMAGNADFEAITGAALRIGKASHLHIFNHLKTIQQIRSKARQLARIWRKAGHERFFFAVDYLQLVTSSSNRSKNSNREQEVSEISGNLKDMSMELHAPVTALSQVNKDAKKEKRRLRTRDLRESGAIENDADLILLLDRPEKDMEYDDPDIEAVRGLAEVCVGKHRNGGCGDVVKLTFSKHCARFENGWTQPQISEENKSKKKR